DDHVPRPRLEGQPRSAVEERVREIEEVPTAGVEPAVREPVDQGRDRDQSPPDHRLALHAVIRARGDLMTSDRGAASDGAPGGSGTSPRRRAGRAPVARASSTRGGPPNGWGPR